MVAIASRGAIGRRTAQLMAFDPDLLPLAGFAAAMIAAAVVDFRRLVIPNGLVAALCVLWLLHIEGTRGPVPAVAFFAAAGAALVLAGGVLLFERGVDRRRRRQAVRGRGLVDRRRGRCRVC